MGSGGAGAGEVFADVAIAIVGGVVADAAGVDGKQAADAACALHFTAEVGAPEEGLFQSENRRDACAPFVFCDAVPSVVEVEGGSAGGGGGACNFRDAAGLGIVLIGGDDAADGSGDEAVFGVPG